MEPFQARVTCPCPPMATLFPSLPCGRSLCSCLTVDVHFASGCAEADHRGSLPCSQPPHAPTVVLCLLPHGCSEDQSPAHLVWTSRFSWALHCHSQGHPLLIPRPGSLSSAGPVALASRCPHLALAQKNQQQSWLGCCPRWAWVQVPAAPAGVPRAVGDLVAALAAVWGVSSGRKLFLPSSLAQARH